MGRCSFGTVRKGTSKFFSIYQNNQLPQRIELVSSSTQVSSAMQVFPVVFSRGVTTVVARILSSSAQNRFSGPFVSKNNLSISQHNQQNLPIRLSHPLLPTRAQHQSNQIDLQIDCLVTTKLRQTIQ